MLSLTQKKKKANSVTRFNFQGIYNEPDSGSRQEQYDDLYDKKYSLYSNSTLEPEPDKSHELLKQFLARTNIRSGLTDLQLSARIFLLVSIVSSVDYQHYYIFF